MNNELREERKESMREDEGELKGVIWLVREEDGMGTVEIILIIVVLVGLVVLFKGQITKIVKGLFDKISSQTESL